MTEDRGGGASRTTDPAAGTSAATDVSLREYVTATTGQKFRSTWAFMVATVAFGAFAWSEIQRRLEILNHENARLLQQQERTVSQDTYAANEQQRKSEQVEFQAWRKEVDRDRTQSISREEFTRDVKVEKRAVTSNSWLIVGGIVGVLALLLAAIATALALSNAWNAHDPVAPAAPVTVTVRSNP